MSTSEASTATRLRPAAGHQKRDLEPDIRAQLDIHCPPLLVLDSHARVVFMSQQATALLQNMPWLYAEHHQRLGSTDPVAEQELRNLQSCLRFADLACEPPQSLSVMLKDETDCERLRLAIRPCETMPQRADDPFAPRWVVRLEPPPEPVLISHQHLVQRYGLTCTEAALAAAITEGATPQQFAQRQQSSIATVRSQLRQVFQKLDTDSQMGVLRRLLTDPEARRQG